jgi:predicted small secreted protein
MTRSFKHTFLLVSIAIVLSVICTACNTAHGFGKDMEKAGEKIQDGTK